MAITTRAKNATQHPGLIVENLKQTRRKPAEIAALEKVKLKKKRDEVSAKKLKVKKVAELEDAMSIVDQHDKASAAHRQTGPAPHMGSLATVQDSDGLTEPEDNISIPTNLQQLRRHTAFYIANVDKGVGIKADVSDIEGDVEAETDSEYKEIGDENVAESTGSLEDDTTAILTDDVDEEDKAPVKKRLTKAKKGETRAAIMAVRSESLDLRSASLDLMKFELDSAKKRKAPEVAKFGR